MALHGAAPERFVSLPALGRDVESWRDWTALWSLVQLMRQFRPPSAIVACQGNTVDHGPAHLGSLGN